MEKDEILLPYDYRSHLISDCIFACLVSFWLLMFVICFLFLFFCTLVIEDHYNPRLVKELLQDLSSTLHSLTIHVGKCVLVGNVNIWLCRLETILKWQQQLNNLQIPKVEICRTLCVLVCFS